MNEPTKKKIEDEVQKELVNVPTSSGKIGRSSVTADLILKRLEYATRLKLENSFTDFTIVKVLNAKAEAEGWGVISVSTLKKQLPRHIAGRIEDLTSEEEALESKYNKRVMIECLDANMELISKIIASKKEVITRKTSPNGTVTETIKTQEPTPGQKVFSISTIGNQMELKAKLEGWFPQNNTLVQNNNLIQNNGLVFNERADKEFADPETAKEWRKYLAGFRKVLDASKDRQGLIIDSRRTGSKLPSGKDGVEGSKA